MILFFTSGSTLAQVIPEQGPGLGNLVYSNLELFKPISWIRKRSEGGVIPPTYPGRRDFGVNVGVMLNGYFLTMFAPDSGLGPGGFLIYDVSNPRNIILKKMIYEPEGRTSELREVHAFGLSTIAGRDIVAVPSTIGVEFWDFTDINNIRQLKKLALPGVNGGDYSDVNWQMWWQAPYLYVAGSNAGVYIVDATDPGNAFLADRGAGRPNPVPTGELGGFRVGPIFTVGNLMVLSSMNNSDGFSMLDISDPLNPRVLSNLQNPNNRYYASCFDGRNLYLSSRGVGGTPGVMAGYDMTDTGRIVKHPATLMIDEQLYCGTQDNFVFQGAQESIHKIDVSNHSNYVEVGTGTMNLEHADHGQVLPMANLVFVGNDHGTGSSFMVHSLAPDRTPPAVVRVSPEPAAEFQQPSSRIGVALTDSILHDSVNSETFIVRPVGGQALPGFYSVQLGIVNFTPGLRLSPDTSYEVVLPANGLKDLAGNGLAQEYRWTFKTSPSVDAASNHWRLSSDLSDSVRGNNGIVSSSDVYAEGGLNFANRASGVVLRSDEVATTLAGSSSVSLMMKTTQTTTRNGAWQAPGIFGRDQIGGSSDVFWGWLDSQGYLRLSVGNQSVENPGARSSARVNDGLWHHVVMTRDALTGAQTIHLDGVKTTAAGITGLLGLSNKFSTLGQFEGASEMFRGILSDVRVYNRVLSDADVAKLREENSLVYRWPLAANLEDEVRSNDGVVGTNDTFADGGLDFSTRSSGVTLRNDEVATVLGGTSSISLYLKTMQSTESSTAANAPGIFGRNQVTGTDDIFWGWFDAQGYLNMNVGDVTAENTGTKSLTRVNDGLWHHVVMTRDATTGVQTMYVDGVESSSVGTPGLMGLGNRFKTLGQIENSSEFFRGVLSEVRVYNRVLNDADVVKLRQEKPLSFHWPLVSDVRDVVRGNDGTPSPGDVFAEGGLNFAGRSGGLQLENDTVADVLGGTASLSFFMNTTQVTTATTSVQAPGIFGRDLVGLPSDVFWGWLDNQGYINLSVGDRVAGNPGTRSAIRVNDGVWHHIGLTRDAVTGAQVVYVDGVKTTSTGLTGEQGLRSKFSMLGQIQGNPDFFRGILSDVRVYDRVLSDAEFALIRSQRPVVLQPGKTGDVVDLDPARLGLSGVSFTWNFGDGTDTLTTSGNGVARHAYDAPGHYTVTVRVTKSDGSIQTYSYMLAITLPLTASAPTASTTITGDGMQVYSVNRDSGTVTATSAQTLEKLWEVAVGTEPATLAIGPGGLIWVAVQGDDKLVVLRPDGTIARNIALAYGSGPHGIAFSPSGSIGVLTLESKSVLATFNPSTGAIRTLALPTDATPRGIAVAGDSQTAYVTRFKSKASGGEVYKVDLATMILTKTIQLTVDTTTRDSENRARGVPNYLHQIVISPDGSRASIPSKKDNMVAGLHRDGTRLRHDTTVRSILSQIDLNGAVELAARQIDFDNRAPARSAVYSPAGDYIFVAETESNRVEIVDAYSGAVRGEVSNAGSTPIGLYIDAARKRLFVNNFLGRSVSAHDVSGILSSGSSQARFVGTVQTVATEPLSATALEGKKIFYGAADLRMSREGYMSCASCHVDGGEDGTVWDFTQRGEGLRRTISLQGREGTGHGRLHWTANFDELQDFEHDIRNEFGGLGFMRDTDYQLRPNPLGAPMAAVSRELDALAAYVETLNTFPRSPSRTAEGCLTPEGQAGRATFNSQNCASCHAGSSLRDGIRHDVGTIAAGSGTGSGLPLAGVGFDTPTLNGVWSTGPYFHNGSAATLPEIFNTGVHSNVPRSEIGPLVTYLRSLDARNICTP